MTVAVQELTVSCKIVSVPAIAVLYLSFEENTNTQASYDHLALQTLLRIYSWSKKFTQSIKYTQLFMKHVDHPCTLPWQLPQKEGKCQRDLPFNISVSWSILRRSQSWAWNWDKTFSSDCIVEKYLCMLSLVITTKPHFKKSKYLSAAALMKLK